MITVRGKVVSSFYVDRDDVQVLCITVETKYLFKTIQTHVWTSDLRLADFIRYIKIIEVTYNPSTFEIYQTSGHENYLG